jgi:O-antigen ligase
MPTAKKILYHPVNRRQLGKAPPRLAAGILSGRWRANVTPAFPKAAIRYAYYAFIFSLPFEGALGGLFLLGLVLAGLTVCQPHLFLKPPPKAFWFFVMYFSVVAVLGVIGILEASRDTQFTRAILTQLFRFSQLLVFFLISYRLMTFEPIAKAALLTLAIACVLLAVLAAAGVITSEASEAISRNVTDERMSTFQDNPNVVASVLSLGLLGLVGLAYGRQDISIKVRLLAWLSSGFLLIAIVRTGSRGSLLALVLALVALTVRRANIPERVRTIFIALVAIACLAWASYQIDAVRKRWEKTYYEGDVAGRQVLVPTAWQMFLEKPIVGWGPVSHTYELGARTGRLGGEPHNLYLWLVLETGLLGACPFFVGLWLCWRSVWRARGSVHGTLPLALLFFLLASNLKGTYLYFKLFWVVLAYSLACGSYAHASTRNYLKTFVNIAKTYNRPPRLRKSFT